ncbi:GntR family transcriptional regulator [Chachezhania sediminis]|uniref:GntR family transcriptional regulator n=1 Tax=Chachezhania sediminis TaxID=2599291 RepID=UPI001E35324B|nr:FCD domain-containing protein [Chachezhania sediminis]
MTVIAADTPEKTISERAYRMIRAEIVSGDLAPGAKLKIEMLRQRYDMGAAPLREALSRLSGDRLVLLSGQRGFVVAPISAKEAADIGNLRKILEIEAIRQSIPLGDTAWEERLITTFHRLSRLEEGEDQGIDTLDEWEKQNAAFHGAIVAACPSDVLLQIRAQLFAQHERYRRFSRIKTVRNRAIHDEHDRLFEAALARDVDTAVEVTGLHIERTTAAVVAALEGEAPAAGQGAPQPA